MLDHSIPLKLQEKIKRELEIGESVSWSGMPIPSFFTPPAIGAFLFGIPWTAFAIFWTVAAGFGTFSMKGGLSVFSLFPLFGVPFVLIGFGMLSAPLMAYFKARKTAYVITDKRAITFEGGRTMVIRSYPPEKLREIYRKEKNNGSGDIVIANRFWKDSEGDQKNEELGFLRVRNAKDVEDRLKALSQKTDARALRDPRRESSPDLYVS